MQASCFCHIVTSLIRMSTEPGKHPGQTHLNSDAKIADEGRPQGRGGHPQGVPLPSFFGQETGLQLPKTYEICDSALRYAQFSALCPKKGAHKGRPYPIQFQALSPVKGAHKGRPYQFSSLGAMPWGGRPQGAPLPIVFSRRYDLGRAPTRGAPTYCLLSAL